MKTYMRRQNLRREYKNIFTGIFQSTSIGMVLTDNSGQYALVNPSFEKLVGYREKELYAMSYRDLTYQEDLPKSDRLFRAVQRGEKQNGRLEIRYIRKDGQVVWVRLNVSRVRSDRDYLLGVIEEVTERKQMEIKLMEAYRMLEQMALVDGLTQIANRRYFDAFLEREYQKAARESMPISVIMLDIDHFKEYNDHYGHVAGDECLQKIACTLDWQVTNHRHLLARYGGEEFAVVLPETGPDEAHLISEALHKSVENLGIPHERSPVSAQVSISIGYASMVPAVHSGVRELLQMADEALYKVKKTGRNSIGGNDRQP